MGCGSSKGQNVANKVYNAHDFPTPDQLAYFQRNYKNSNKTEEKKSQQNSKNDGKDKDPNKNNLSKPTPSSVAKSQVFKPADFKQIDQRAQKTPISVAAESYASLVNYLTQPAKNDVGKARAFYVWIASQRLQPLIDYTKKKDVTKDSPLYMMLHILVKQWGNGYSELFKRLCQQANLECSIVSGRVKGSGYKIGEKADTINNWIIVKLGGRWGIVDQHWGSLFVVGNVYNSDWDMLKDADENDNKPAAAAPAEEETCQICDDFYFLPDPEAIVFTHLAIDPKQQLLARPVTEDEFWQMAVLKDAFFELEMTTINHPKCLLNSDQNGQAVFLFGLSKNRHCLFRYSLFKSAFEEKANLVNGVSVDRYVIVQKVKDTLKITIHFPKIGRYKFDLYGKDKKSKSGYQVVAEYAINCQKPDLKFEPLPENTRSEWGPGQDTAKFGLEPVFTDEGIIYAKEGKAAVGFKMTEAKDLQFQSTLIDPKNPKENLNDCVRHYIRDNNEVHFHMKVPQHGNYILELNAKNPNEKKFSSVCNYLVKADQGCYDLAPYPDADNKTGQTGALLHGSNDLKITPVSHKSAIIDPFSPKNELNIQLKTTKPDADYKAQMRRFYSPDNVVEDVSDYVFLNQTKDALNAHANFPEVGFYKLDVLARNKIVYQYLINVPKPNVDCAPFAKRQAGWKSDFEAVEPKKAYLVAGKKTSFKFVLPKAKKARMEGSGVSKELVSSKEHPDVFEGEVATPTDGGPFTLKADFGAEKTTQNVSLLTYTVLGGQIKKEIDKKSEEAERKAEEHLKEMEEQKEMEEKMMLKKQKEDELRVKMMEEDFRKNKDKYEKEEILLQKKELEREKLAAEGKLEDDKPKANSNAKTKQQQQRAEADDKTSITKRHVDKNDDDDNARTKTTNGHVDTRPSDYDDIVRPRVIVADKTSTTKRRDDEANDDRQREGSPRVVKINQDEDEEGTKKPVKVEPKTGYDDGRKEAEREKLAERESKESPKTYRKQEPSPMPVKRSPVNHADVIVKTHSLSSDFDSRNSNKSYRYGEADSETSRFSSANDEFDLREDKRIYKVDGTEDWKRYHPRLTNSIALERLRDSIRKRDKTMLESAIDTCHESGLKENREVKNAAVTLQALQARKKLDKAVESKDPAAIRRELDNINNSGLLRFLQHEHREANYTLEAIERPSHLHKNVLNMDHKTMSEVRRYKNPPPMFHKIMQATFLLLGEDEDSTSTWKDVQRLCNPQGVNGLNRRILNFDAEKVHPEIAARSDQILRDVDVDKVRAVSPGAGTFYVWSKGAIDEVKSIKDTSKARPANKERQKEIFERGNYIEAARNGYNSARWL